MTGNEFKLHIRTKGMTRKQFRIWIDPAHVPTRKDLIKWEVDGPPEWVVSVLSSRSNLIKQIKGDENASIIFE